MINTWRQVQARESLLDHLAAEPQGRSEGEMLGDAVRAAVEVATSVKITKDVIDAFEKNGIANRLILNSEVVPVLNIGAGLAAALNVLGFEIVP